MLYTEEKLLKVSFYFLSKILKKCYVKQKSIVN